MSIESLEEKGQGRLKKTLKPSDVISWTLVTAIIREYKKRRPEEFSGCLEYVKRLRANQKTKFAELGTDANMRYMYEIPSGLKIALEMKFPLLFQEKNLAAFLRRFPAFSVTEKI